ncbi:MAG: hypothetical protein EOM12_03375 [Verrucomicrobiae bacterium]|nr:hypothetical protein [Verrucomicrobiae bacterium]
MASKKTADDYKDILKYAFLKNRADFERMQSNQRLYDNQINEDLWPTESSFGLAYLFTAVHDMLPMWMDYGFPDLPIVSLTPRNDEVDVDAVRKVEWLLHDTVLNKMKLKKHGYKTLQNCLKLGVGIGIVEPAYTTPMAKYAIPSEGKEFIAPGEKERVVRYRNICPLSICPYPDGADFNGQDAVSITFFIDTYSEESLRALHNEQPDELKATWDPETIIDKARLGTYDLDDDIEEFIKKVGGKRVWQADGRAHIPVNIPVLKVYEPHRHVWLALGEDIIFETESKIQTFRVPLVKASAWPDGDRFYPMSVPDALREPAFAYNIWVNLIYDMMTWNTKRPFMYDETKISDPEFGPNGRIKVQNTDDVRVAGMWLEPPGIGNDTMAVGDKLQQIVSNISGHKDYTDRNFTRGGMGAFKELLNSMEGREKLAASVIETGWQHDVYEQTLIYIQNTTDKKQSTVVTDFNDEGKRVFNEMTVTPEEIIHVFDISLDSRGVQELSVSMQDAMQYYQMFRDDPMVNPHELRRLVTRSESLFRKLWKSKAEMEKIQAQNRQMEMEERRNGIQQAAQGQAEPGQPQQQAQGLGGPPQGL